MDDDDDDVFEYDEVYEECSEIRDLDLSLRKRPNPFNDRFNEADEEESLDLWEIF